MARQTILPRKRHRTPVNLSRSNAIFLAVETGATSVVASLADSRGRILARCISRPLKKTGNFSALLRQLKRKARVDFSHVRRVVICMAGISQKGAIDSIRKECRVLMLGCRPEIVPDIFSTLAATLGESAGIVVIAGTGSCVLAQDGHGHVRRSGGWGERFGDDGSGYAIGREAVRALLAAEDGSNTPSALTRLLARKIEHRGVAAIIAWAQAATKSEIAALSPLVFSCAKKVDAQAMQILENAAASLKEQIIPLVLWLQNQEHKDIRVVLAGGVFEHHREYADYMDIPGSCITELSKIKKGHGAMLLAQGKIQVPRWEAFPYPHETQVAMTLPATEASNPRSKGIDKLSAAQIVGILLHEDSFVPRAVLRQKISLAKAVECLVSTLREAGRVFYVGAGTSGRLAALDAAELPPTFGLPQGIFEVIVAGGDAALENAAEGAEDDEQSALKQLEAKQFSCKDVLVGVAASGTTPFVLAAVAHARRIGAKTIAITCNTATPLEKACDIAIVACVGPEIIAGSTRMKAGTATKLILNTLSTATMIRMGKVLDHCMVDVAPTNKKLRARASRIISQLTGQDSAQSEVLLDQAKGKTKAAVLMARHNISQLEAEKRLSLTQGNLREALE